MQKLINIFGTYALIGILSVYLADKALSPVPFLLKFGKPFSCYICLSFWFSLILCFYLQNWAETAFAGMAVSQLFAVLHWRLINR